MGKLTNARGFGYRFHQLIKQILVSLLPMRDGCDTPFRRKKFAARGVVDLGDFLFSFWCCFQLGHGRVPSNNHSAVCACASHRLIYCDRLAPHI